MKVLWSWLLELCDLDRQITPEEGAAWLAQGLEHIVVLAEQELQPLLLLRTDEAGNDPRVLSATLAQLLGVELPVPPPPSHVLVHGGSAVPRGAGTPSVAAPHAAPMPSRSATDAPAGVGRTAMRASGSRAARAASRTRSTVRFIGATPRRPRRRA